MEDILFKILQDEMSDGGLDVCLKNSTLCRRGNSILKYLKIEATVDHEWAEAFKTQFNLRPDELAEENESKVIMSSFCEARFKKMEEALETLKGESDNLTNTLVNVRDAVFMLEAKIEINKQAVQVQFKDAFECIDDIKALLVAAKQTQHMRVDCDSGFVGLVSSPTQPTMVSSRCTKDNVSSPANSKKRQLQLEEEQDELEFIRLVKSRLPKTKKTKKPKQRPAAATTSDDDDEDEELMSQFFANK